jgi:hypothetical protein
MSGGDKLATIPIFSPAAKPSDPSAPRRARGGIGNGALVGARRRRWVGALCCAHPTTVTLENRSQQICNGRTAGVSQLKHSAGDLGGRPAWASSARDRIDKARASAGNGATMRSPSVLARK